eukprot:CAMPEP_0173245014 /NCGR_PEP_ID=MMETSP1142-20121109/16485_1 /TAXON_ID=483371 /ORGANISM="non described non described, Strain CCMP2298" /LENGTH=85 /DNA_ID=CAMNT_0014176997 /DNA_START=303 /DNA_END=560 /DNA_ORIENTATION=+
MLGTLVEEVDALGLVGEHRVLDMRVGSNMGQEDWWIVVVVVVSSYCSATNAIRGLDVVLELEGGLSADAPMPMLKRSRLPTLQRP